ncbi:ribonuclease N1 [Amycolatopsis taiwanensis]|uniref:Ribonuclease N1 n=1 Tax=Amycolatopsis taiwanensis TaxID=342230 RepID=A0A9W6R145_9PSEU|nr:ribonuclease N1 [Amycolatopsis taiwanensis]
MLVLGGWLIKDLGGVTEPGLHTVALSTLPPEAGQTYRLIEAGGPFRYPQDGTVFENREKLLPRQPSGYYHEYTVPTPGSADRGPRRLIAGDGRELYYTGDHYQTFVAVDPTK